MKRALVAAAFALAACPAALAHGPVGGGVGYVSTVAGLKPNIVGVFVTVLGGDDRLQLTNYSGKTVEVLGYEREPYLRFSKNGIYQNLRSPLTYLGVVRDQTQVNLPPAADANAAPHWLRVSAGSSYAWHDRRIRWVGTQPPPVVQQEPKAEHRIFQWRVPARADGSAFLIEGFLGYRPVAGDTGGAGTPAWEIALGAALLAAAVALVGVGARRSRRRAP